LASSPALRLLRSIEDRWTQATPVATDELPLVRPVTRPVAPLAAAPPGRSAVGAVGLVLALASLTPLLLIRRPRRPAMNRTTIGRRLSRVYS
ncbi:MAG TPA: hypothetical protein VGA69_10535, partial [Nitriliruptorales bacterium]